MRVVIRICILLIKLVEKQKNINVLIKIIKLKKIKLFIYFSVLIYYFYYSVDFDFFTTSKSSPVVKDGLAYMVPNDPIVGESE